MLAVVLEEAGRALLPEPLLVSAVLGARAVLAAPIGEVPDRIVQDVVGGRLVATVATRHQVAGDLTVSESDDALSVVRPVEPRAARRERRPRGRPRRHRRG